MESDGASSFLRNRKSESFFSAPKSMDGKNETECDARNIPYVDEGVDLCVDIMGPHCYMFCVYDVHDIYMGPDHGGFDPVALSED